MQLQFTILDPSVHLCECGCGNPTNFYRGVARRFLRHHNGRCPLPLEDRFWAKVSQKGPVPEGYPSPGNCWLWTGRPNRDGYGHIQNSPKPEGRTLLVHRLSYQLQRGPIVDGLQIDHLCRNHACVNPLHLEVVTARTNILRGNNPTAINARKTECPRGHPLSGDNLYITPTGGRSCRLCRYRYRKIQDHHA